MCCIQYPALGSKSRPTLNLTIAILQHHIHHVYTTLTTPTMPPMIAFHRGPKARAQKRRWVEEALLKEEMRRVRQYLEWEVNPWEGRGNSWFGLQPDIRAGSLSDMHTVKLIGTVCYLSCFQTCGTIRSHSQCSSRGCGHII
jgi:hypothetical protein